MSGVSASTVVNTGTVFVDGTGTVTGIVTGTGLTGGTITTSGTIALANTGVTPGSYVNANIQVDAQGRLLVAQNGSGSGTGTVTSIVIGDGLELNGEAGGTLTTTGTLSASGGGGGGVTKVYTDATLDVDGSPSGTISATGTLGLPNSGVTAGSYTNADITVDAQGRVTAASDGGSGGAGALILLGSVTCSGSQTSITFSDIPAGYVDLQIRARGCAVSGSYEALYMWFNGDNASNNYGYSTFDGSTIAVFNAVNYMTVTNRFGFGEVIVAGYASAGFTINIYNYQQPIGNVAAFATGVIGSLTAYALQRTFAGTWKVQSTPVTSISFNLQDGVPFLDGSVFSLYGVAG